jgi:hypothetical protein
MDYEKAYKEALERAREFQKSKDGLCVLTAESIFPELQESEEERIRKMIINHLTQERGSLSNDEAAEAIAWLEKQGEKKPTWSEEDEEYLRRAINATKDGYPMTTKWLKSLKTRLS